MKKLLISIVAAFIGIFAFAGSAFAADLQSMVKYYTINNGTSFLRSVNPFTETEYQHNNSDGSITVGVEGASVYADSGVVIYDGRLGDLDTFSITGTGQYGVNLWFDTLDNGEFFVWDINGKLTSLDGDSYGLGPQSSPDTLTVDGNSVFYMMTSPYSSKTLTQLKAGEFSGINSDTHIAIWVGVNVGDQGGTISATISSISGFSLGCTKTGFYRDGIDLTAALINPSNTVSGDVDATGCNIGVYYGPGYDGVVDNANIHGANYYGVVVQQANVDVIDSEVHDIGELPNFNGAQHGVAVYYANVAGLNNGDCTTEGSTSGLIDNNTIYRYQKGGVVISCVNTDVDVTNNTVTGLGLIDFIAQNGIQISSGAVVSELENNLVTGNAYMTGKNMALGNGPWISCGLLFYQSGMTKGEQGSSMSRNTIRQNRANLCNF